MSKLEIRNLYIERRNDLSPRQVTVKSLQISSRVKSVIDWPVIKSLHIYKSVPAWNEVSTDYLIHYIQKNWPHIRIVVGDPHKRSEIPNGQFDIILVPILAFDNNLNRLGFGGGWYDRFLKNQTESTKIGLAYHCQRVLKLPAEAHDISMNTIVTERRVIKKLKLIDIPGY